MGEQMIVQIKLLLGIIILLTNSKTENVNEKIMLSKIVFPLCF